MFLGLLYGVFKCFIVYDVAKEPLSSGGVPTLDGVIFPPIFITIGLSVVIRLHPFWWCLVIWLLLMIFFGVSHWVLTRIGERRHRTANKADQSLK